MRKLIKQVLDALIKGPLKWAFSITRNLFERFLIELLIVVFMAVFLGDSPSVKAPETPNVLLVHKTELTSIIDRNIV